MRSRRTFIFHSAIAMFGVFLFLGLSTPRAADAVSAGEGAGATGGCGTRRWTEYKCESANTCSADASNKVLKRTGIIRRSNVCVKTGEDCVEIEVDGKKQQKCTPIYECECVEEDPEYSPETVDTDCGRSRVCAGPEEWRAASPAPDWCECKGACYVPPTQKELNDETLKPKNVFESRSEGDPKKPKLPFVLGWQDDAAKQVAADGCAVGSYRYEIAGGAKPESGTTGAGELQTIMQDCRLSPDAPYAWKIQACIDGNGKDCGSWSKEKSFATSSAPELKSPFDPDFEGGKNGASTLPLSLRWCQDPNANSYKLHVYDANGSVILEHPLEKYATRADSDSDLLVSFKTGLRYLWSLFSCADFRAERCRIKSQRWSVVPVTSLGVPTALNSRAVVNVSDALSWNDVPYAPFYMVYIEREGEGNAFMRPENSLPIAQTWSKLRTDTAYSWKVAACAGGVPEESSCGAWSASAFFRTAGAPPQNLKALPSQDNLVGVPFELQWSEQEGSLSYAYEIASDQEFKKILRKGVLGVGQNPRVEIARQDPRGEESNAMRPGQTYYARAATCADMTGTQCGQWTVLPIATAPLGAPKPVSPLPAQETYTPRVDISWSRTVGQNYYTYRVFYEKPSLEEKNASCLQSPKDKLVSEGVADSPRMSFSPSCVGSYKAEVIPCADRECKEKGTPAIWTFQVKEPASPSFFGIVPCGRANDDLGTPWHNERESCQLKHAVLFLHNLVNFFLWRAIPVLIVLYAIFSGAIFYFSFGNPGVLVQVKSIWRAVGVGMIILLVSWMSINLFLGILGFNITIFGRWYEISF